MSKLLTISIPTYNRAGMLQDQLTWLSSEIIGFEKECNIVVNDNCSTDHTDEVVQLWKSGLDPRVDFTYNIHPQNIGGMRNIMSCISAAKGKFVWTLGDDDPIAKGAVSYIINKIKTYEDLALILLNGNGRDKLTNRIIVDRWFNKSSETPYLEGSTDFKYFLKYNMGGVLFISSAVYRAEYAQEALSLWPESHANLAGQAFWVGYTAACGSFIVTPQLFTECAMGIGFTDKDPQFGFKIRFGLAEVYLKLMQSGYSRKFCYFSMIENLRRTGDWRILLGSLRRWPYFSVKGLKAYFKNVLHATTLIFAKKERRLLQKKVTMDHAIDIHGK